MTDKEKRELKDGVISIFKMFNILDHTATIGGLRNDILRYIDSLQEEPVSEDLEEASEEYAYTNWQSDDYHDGAAEGLPFDAIGHTQKTFKAGAEWQKKQDQSTIELAEDHAMLAGMNKMEQQMMENAIDATIGLPYENKDGGYTHLIDVSRPLPVGNNKIAIIFKED